MGLFTINLGKLLRIVNDSCIFDADAVQIGPESKKASV